MVPMPENAPSAPAMPQGQKKSMMPMLVMVFALLGVIMLGASLTMTWYTTKVDGGEGAYEAKEDFKGYDTNGKRDNWADLKGVDNSKALYSNVYMLLILGVVMSVLLVIGGAMLMMKPKMKMMVAILGILALVFSMLGPVMFMTQHQVAWKADAPNSTGDGPWSSFSGSTSVSGANYSWGPSMGWTVALVGFIFTLLGAIFVFTVKGAPKGS